MSVTTDSLPVEPSVFETIVALPTRRGKRMVARFCPTTIFHMGQARPGYKLDTSGSNTASS